MLNTTLKTFERVRQKSNLLQNEIAFLIAFQIPKKKEQRDKMAL